MKFLIKHWQGKHPLWFSLWINFIGLLLLISVVAPILLNRFFPNSEDRILPTIFTIAVTSLLVFPWQMIGLLRATDRDYLEHGRTLQTRVIQLIIIIGLIFMMVFGIESIQNVMSTNHKETLETLEPELSKYSFVIDIKARQLSIKGDFEIGITEAVKAIIKENLNIKTVLLESVGGNIYEGRGLSKLFTKHQINTIVTQECSSACATAFIGGAKRYIENGAKIGFHQYKQDTERFPKAVPFHNLEKEQTRDLEMFKSQGINQTFLNRVFDQPASRIWFPATEVLLEAGVVHEII